jgi:signal transduction histidine kinase
VSESEDRPSDSAGPGSLLVAGLVGVLGVCGALVLPAVSAQDSEVAVGVPSIGSAPWWLVVLVLLAQAGALVRVRSAPRTVLLVVTALPLLVLLAPGALFSLTALATVVAVYLATVAGPEHRSLPALALAFVLVAGGQFVNELRLGELPAGLALGGALAQALLLIGAPSLAGLFVAARREAERARRGEAAALRREQEGLVQAAISRERTAMSRELHDIAAHHMSGIALMASAIERQVDSDPPAAKRSAAQIRDQSRTVLEDLRRVVGLLREDAAATRSVETLAAVQELVDARREAGAEIDVVVLSAQDGAPLGTGIGALTQLVVYRMVQEALANAAAHAPGARCVVRLDDRGDALIVTVANDPPAAADPAPGSGFGLLGMRERAEMIGAELSCGPTAGGGWEARLSVPRDQAIGRGTERSEGESA